MIKISKKEDYGLLFASYLAGSYGKKLISVGVASKNLKVSPFFLSQIAALLKKADLVESREGVEGGYQLKKSPSEITVGEVVRAVSGPLMQAGRLMSVKNHAKESLVWQKIALEVVRTLDTITLSKL